MIGPRVTDAQVAALRLALRKAHDEHVRDHGEPVTAYLHTDEALADLQDARAALADHRTLEAVDMLARGLAELAKPVGESEATNSVEFATAGGAPVYDRVAVAFVRPGGLTPSEQIHELARLLAIEHAALEAANERRAIELSGEVNEALRGFR